MSSKSIQFIILTMLITFVSSCGKKVDEEVSDAVLSANILLSTSQCQAAIDLLEAVGNQPRNAKYLKTLSSAYACRAGYSTITLFGSDVAKTTMPSPLGGMTTYSTSQKTVTAPLQNDSGFKDLQRAIDILLYAGGIELTTEPTAVERAKYFTANEVGDINSEVTFMMLAQMGKFMKVYANADASGVKGTNGAGNNCFTNYATTPAAIQTYVTTILAGACTSVNSSHTQLAVGVTNRKARLCQGVVLLNSILDTLPSVLASAGGGSLSDIASLTGSISTQKHELVTRYPAIGSTATVTSQTNCEADTAITLDTLASYYAIVYEGLIR